MTSETDEIIESTQFVCETPPLVKEEATQTTPPPTGDSDQYSAAQVRRMQLQLRTALSKRYVNELDQLRRVEVQSQKKRNDADWKWAWRTYSEYYNDHFWLTLSKADQEYVMNYMWNCGRTAGWKTEVLDEDLKQIRGLFDTHQWTDGICRAAVHCEEYLDDMAQRTTDGTAKLPTPRIKHVGELVEPKSKLKRSISNTVPRVIDHAYKVAERFEMDDIPTCSTTKKIKRGSIAAKRRLERAVVESASEEDDE